MEYREGRIRGMLPSSSLSSRFATTCYWRGPNGGKAPGALICFDSATWDAVAFHKTRSFPSSLPKRSRPPGSIFGTPSIRNGQGGRKCLSGNGNASLIFRPGIRCGRSTAISRAIWGGFSIRKKRSLAAARDFACGLPLRSRPQIGPSSNPVPCSHLLLLM